MNVMISIIINILIASVFYLIISLKLEKSSSTFRETKLRKEMDEIIREFNATAERNINILERKITILKRLMEKTGDYESVDYIIGEEDRTNNEEKQIHESLPPEKETGFNEVKRPPQNHSGGNKLLQSLLDIKDQFVEKFIDPEKEEPVEIYSGDYPINDLNEEPLVSNETYIIEKDLRGLDSSMQQREPESETDSEGEEDRIREVISSTDDKYEMISLLYSQGYSVDIISRYSGISVGEINLVINMQNPG